MLMLIIGLSKSIKRLVLIVVRPIVREGDDSGGPSARIILLAGCVTCFFGNLHFPVC